MEILCLWCRWTSGWPGWRLQKKRSQRVKISEEPGQSHVISGCNGRIFFFYFFFSKLCNFSFFGEEGFAFVLPSLKPTDSFSSLWIFSTTVTIHSTMKYFVRSSQHRHHLIVFMLLFLILFHSYLMSYSRCFIHFDHLGLRFLYSRQYCAGKLYQHQNLTHFITFYIWCHKVLP